MLKIKIEVIGEKPLVMDPKTEEVMEQIRGNLKRPTTPQFTGLTVQQEAEKKIIRDNGKKDGVIGIPALYLRECIRNMSKMDKKYAKILGFTSPRQVGSIITSLIDVEEEFLPLTGSLKWQVDKRPFTTNRGVGQVNVRPKFPEWGFKATLRINENILKAEVAKRLVEEAGLCVGVGTARPLGFGRFKIVKWEIMK